MTKPLSMDQAFIRKLTDIVLANLQNEKFGVNELAREASISRFTINRRLKSVLNQDTGHFIRGIRLKRAMEMLQDNEGTVAEIAFRVGFSSPAYFNRCFHEYYGFPPGEVKKRRSAGAEEDQADQQNIASGTNYKPALKKITGSILKSRYFKIPIVTSLGILSGLLIIYFIYILLSHNPDNSKAKEIPEKSIAVLPFKNLSDDPENQYFADGIMEDILNHLFRIKEFRVISRTTSEQFRGTNMISPEIAKKLNVNYVLEGSVLRSGNNVRIFVQLIDARNDQHLWSEKYDKEMADIFAIQSDIAFQIADNLETALSPEEIEQIGKIPTKNSEAYTLYLYGRFFWSKRTKQDLKLSEEYFKRSIVADTNFALAYAGLADAYFAQSCLACIPWGEGNIKAKEMALKALELDKDLAEGHAVYGMILTWFEWKFEEARKELEHANKLNPKLVTAHMYYSELLDVLRENVKAREEINTALEIDPFMPMLHRLSSLYYYNEERYKESLDALNKAQDLDQSTSLIWLYINIYLMNREDVKAVEGIEKAWRTDSLRAEHANDLIIAFNKYGIDGVNELRLELEKKNNGTLYNIARIYALLGRKDETLDYLEKEFENPGSNYIRINNDPFFNDLRSEPRFRTLLKKIGLSEYN
jgi:TolB-like protein/AraC-like DNA-binding protein